jgi:molybdopterin molybdotransferase
LVRLKGFKKLTSPDKALGILFSALSARDLKKTVLPLNACLNRVLAADIVAQEDLPRFDRSAVDGYALRAENTTGASQFKPKIFSLTTENKLNKKLTKQVWTGNPIPSGASAVVMLENTKKIDDKIEVWTTLTPGENVAKKGEDVKNGETALKAGTRLKPHHLGLAAALGFSKLSVHEKPTVAVLATGNELVAVGSERGDNQIFETNGIVVSALCRELGAEVFDLGIVRDDVDEIANRLRIGLNKSDMVITTGGTSVGVSDLVPDSVNSLGKPGIIVHGIALRPAMPTALAVIDKKPVIVLSGNPVAAMVGFEVFARPLICMMLGLKTEEKRPVVEAKMTRKVTAALGRETHVRVRVFQENDQYLAEPVSARGSGTISTMTRANGYVVVPENREGLGEGEVVRVQLFDTIYGRL